MAQHLRIERALGTGGAVTLWLAGLVSLFGFFSTVAFVIGAGIAVIGALLLWFERIVARRNMTARLGYDWHRDSSGSPGRDRG